MSRSILDPRLCFVCEYVDDMANLTREFQLLYFYDDNSVELTELKTKKVFLRRVTCPGLCREQFYLGGDVTIYGRVMKLTKFGDEVTRQLCEESAEYTTLVFSEECFPKMGSALAVLTQECGFGVKSMNTVVLSSEAAKKCGLPSQFANKRAVVMQAVRAQAVALGAEYVKRIGSSVAAASDKTTADAWQCLFSETSSAILDGANTATIILKPHALQKQLGGEMVQLLLNAGGLKLAAMRLVALSATQADYLLQPYKGVLVDYSATVASISGNSWVVQFYGSDSCDVLSTVRQTCGPFDTVIARTIAPKSLRARFGQDRVFNAVHCTDVPEDANVYASYFFSIHS